MKKFILKNNKRFQILNVLTDLVDVFRPKIFEPGNVRVRTRKTKTLGGSIWVVKVQKQLGSESLEVAKL